ncbi:hypothetical protein LTR37_020203 [Vermiconidia calcicola]|uniref:Uncharacterized protein n=1 Tax=Vermiconidia calcicola TaxID=1690605 RepID=A0ACC3MDW6_9PEZI|nr:hypothetical protein LTR37_020203 [Vermiconidia calcicola]
MNAVNGAGSNGESEREDIVIVGGSLGGLFAGVVLKCHGYNTTIFERTNQFLLENQGAGVVAGGDTIEFFEKYDRTGKPVAVPSYKRLYLNQKGDIIHEKVNRQNMTSWDLLYYLMRANYDRVDSPYLEGGKLPEKRPSDGTVNYRYGCTVTNIVDEGSRVRIHFKRKAQDGAEVDDSLTTRLVIAADGPSSTIRSILEPSVKRDYAGYVVIRGTVPELEASQGALEVFRERFCFFHAGENGNTSPSHRLLNFVWYANFPDGSAELERIMTDKDGRRRKVTIPPGMITWDAWEMLKSKASEKLPPQMAEMAHKSKNPFVQCITDVTSPRNFYMDNKVVLIGDALAGFRPHTVASTSQAAFNVMGLVDWLDGNIDRRQYVKQTMQYARLIQSRGVHIGNRSQFESLPIEDYIEDRNMMSSPRPDLAYPEWTAEGLDSI